MAYYMARHLRSVSEVLTPFRSSPNLVGLADTHQLPPASRPGSLHAREASGPILVGVMRQAVCVVARTYRRD